MGAANVGRSGDGARPFFITGLPRSRTAWMANLFTTGRVFCWHEALLSCHAVADLQRLVPRNAFVGNSDSALILFHSQVKQMYPGSPWVVIERDSKNAFDSMVKKYGRDVSDGGWSILESAFRILPREAPGLLRVRYEDLDDVDVIRRLWHHCLPTVPFDEQRWGLLKDLRVERIPQPGDVARERSLAQELFRGQRPHR